MAVIEENQYLLAELAGVPYLLPYGQKLADHKTLMRLNQTAALIWKQLESGRSEEEIVSELALRFDLGEADLPELARDVETCIGVFSRGTGLPGIVTEPALAERFPREPASLKERPPGEAEVCLGLGPLTFWYRGPASLPERFFRPFVREPRAGDGTITVLPSAPPPGTGGRLLVRNRDVEIREYADGCCFSFPAFPGVHEIVLEKKTGDILAFCEKELSEERQENLFHALRFAYLVAAQRKGFFMLHSASVAYRGEAWLFSGSSGTGKSTQAGHWHRRFHTPHLNGDLNLIGEKDGRLLVFGQPWCGTSGICTPEQVPLGGIVFLKQAGENDVSALPEDEKILNLLNRTISPGWKRQQMERNIALASAIAGNARMFRFQCTAEPGSADVLKRAVDRAYDS